MSDKIDRVIYKRIIERLGKGPISYQSLVSNYLGELAFLLVDSYGVSRREAFELIEDLAIQAATPNPGYRTRVTLERRDGQCLLVKTW